MSLRQGKAFAFYPILYNTTYSYPKLTKEYGIIVVLFQYNDNDEVVLWMNTVGPYHNRQETYTYFSLPFCRGPKETISHYHETLGEALLGVELDFSGFDIRYKSRSPYMRSG